MKNYLQKYIPFILRFAPIALLLGVFFFLYLLFFFESANIKTEENTTKELLKAHATSLIHSFEASFFASRTLSDEEIESLLTEQANDPNILFLALIDQDRKIITASNPHIIDKTINTIKEGEQQNITQNTSDAIEKISFQASSPSSLTEENMDTFSLQNQEVFLVEKQLFTNISDQRAKRLGRYKNPEFSPNKKKSRDEAEKQKDTILWNARRLFHNDKEMYMLVAFDTKEILEATEIDSERKTVHVIILGSLLLIGFFALIILKAYYKFYHLTQDSKNYIISLLNALPLGIITLDHEQNILTINPTAENLTKVQKIDYYGKKIAELIPPLTFMQVDTILKNKTLMLHANTHNPIAVELNTFPISPNKNEGTQAKNPLSKGGTGIIIQDLREIQKLQAELHRQERLASVGKLAAGIAHEIRNPLGTIKGIARFFEEKAKSKGEEKDSDETKLATVMTQEIVRVDKVIHDLLEISRPNIITPKMTVVTDLLEKAKNSVVLNLPKHITLQEEIVPTCTHAFLDEDRIIQVLQNIFLNAIQAIQTIKREQGIILVTVQCTKTPHHELKDFTSHLEISIEDNGNGIAEENIKNLFTPYYTNKASGTGLGLVMVQKIIEAHKGTVKVESELGFGTKVIIRIPQ